MTTRAPAVIYNVIKDVSDGEIGPQRLMIMLMYIDFGGISLLKKCQNKLGQCPKERCFFLGWLPLV